MRISDWSSDVCSSDLPDLGLVREVIAAATPDVVALQEVQRGQARAPARQLGWSVAWRFKHWSVVVPPEGLGLLSPRSLAGATRIHLARSEEHTSELKSLMRISYAVFCLKKKIRTSSHHIK